MLKRLLATAALVAIGLANADEATGPTSGFGVSLGGKAMHLSNMTFSHNTHPDDSLPLSNVPGSAGTTSLDGEAYYARLAVGYKQPIFTKNLSCRVELGGLYGGRDDRKKNANDSRPDASASFIYSSTSWGFDSTFDLMYSFGPLYVGGGVEYTGIFFDSGWDRYSHKQSEKSSLSSNYAAGPILGISLSRNTALEAAARFGKSQVFEVGLKLYF